jgi:hypothetical protein
MTNVREAIARAIGMPDQPAASLFLSPDHARPGNEADPLRLRGLVADIREQAHRRLDGETATMLTEQVETMALGYDLLHPAPGVVVYATTTEGLIVEVPYPVGDRAVVSDGFVVRDLLLARQLHPRYRVLVLSNRESRLYESNERGLHEVGKGFPVVRDYPREEDTPHRDLPRHEHERATATAVELRATAHAAAAIDAIDPLPTVLVGAERDLAAFTAADPPIATIAGSIHGNHLTTPPRDLAALCEPVVAAWTERNRRAAVAQLWEAIGTRAVAGLTAVWEAVREGRGRTLLVEWDHEAPARLHDHRLVLVDGEDAPDGVELAVREVLRHDGAVVFVDPGALAEAQHVALILRY